jgi:hypothetical protein
MTKARDTPLSRPQRTTQGVAISNQYRVEKDCYKCGRSLDESEFHRNISRADGLNDACKTCTRAAAKERYWRDPAAARERSRRSVMAVIARRRERTPAEIAEARVLLTLARGKNVLYVGAGESDRSSATSTAQAA